MTQMLASVNCLAEALLVLDAGVGIIDLKQPAQGALGALDTVLVKHIVTEINGRSPVSATIGDLPMLPNPVFNAVLAMAETGVDYIKIGFFPGDDWSGTLQKLSEISQTSALIAVLFADTAFDLNFLGDLKKAGFSGVMLDTMDKRQGTLTQLMAAKDIAEFVGTAKSLQLLCGLAGSLRLSDVPELMRHQPDYLGFRGALCQQHQRSAALDPHAVEQIRDAIGNTRINSDPSALSRII
ncbi:MAG: (5-formylfuran-3-yl)methyl phosphate synthase [Methylococcales bacterium]|nr:(5-formylfuran-3-yl)methyl phosphate synthase [Methylococcales bacterium]